MGNKVYRVFEISRDSHFQSLISSGISVTWIPTGPPLTPGSQIEQNLERLKPRLISIFKNLLLNRYDLIVLPAIHEDWHHDKTLLKQILRFCMILVSKSNFLSRLLNRMAGLRKPQIIVLDYADSTKVSDSTLNIFPYIDLYFKRNLPILQNDFETFDEHGGHHFRDHFFGNSNIFRYLPMGFNCSNYPASENSKKTTDVFFAGQLNSKARCFGLQILEQLKSEGYDIDVATERLPFDAYLSRMSKAWITLSPEGNGHHSWRHYESLLVGSVPAINHPCSPIALCLKNEDTCLYYSYDSSDLIDVLAKALASKDKLRRIAEKGRKHVLLHHSKKSIAHYILNELNEISAKIKN